MRGSGLSPEASFRLDKFVADEFVTPLPPLSNANYLGINITSYGPDGESCWLLKSNNKHIFYKTHAILFLLAMTEFLAFKTKEDIVKRILYQTRSITVCLAADGAFG